MLTDIKTQAQNGRNNAARTADEVKRFLGSYESKRGGYTTEMDSLIKQIRFINSEVDMRVLEISTDCISKCKTGSFSVWKSWPFSKILLYLGIYLHGRGIHRGQGAWFLPSPPPPHIWQIMQECPFEIQNVPFCMAILFPNSQCKILLGNQCFLWGWFSALYSLTLHHQWSEFAIIGHRFCFGMCHFLTCIPPAPNSDASYSPVYWHLIRIMLLPLLK